MRNKNFYSVLELSRIMRLSRSQVFRKIKAGQIPAERVGRSFVVPIKFVYDFTGKVMPEDKELIDEGVKRVVAQYGEVLKKLAGT